MGGGGHLTQPINDLLVLTAANIAVGVNYSDSSNSTPSPWAQGGMMDFLFGADMPLAVRFFFAFVIVLALIGGTAFLVRRFGGERLGASSARSRQPRLAVIDAAAVDGRRRLILIRRDNVEHLLMIGGPSDVVVEANIVRAAAGARDVPGARPPAGLPEPLPRAAATNEGNMWPLQPEPAPAPAARPSRQQQPPMDEPVQWNAEPEPPAPIIPPRRAEARPEMRMEPRSEMRIEPMRMEPRAEMRAEPRAETRAEPRAEMRAEPRAEMRPEPRAEMRPEPRAEMRPEPRAEMRMEPRAEMRSEPRAESRSDARNADPLAGLAAELARVQAEPPPPLPKARPPRERDVPRDGPRPRAPQPERPAEQRLRAVPPPAEEPAASNADQNLAEMAQRLEAALRRPKQGAEPRAPEAAPRPAMAGAPASSEPMMDPAPVPMMAEPVVGFDDAPTAPPRQAPSRPAAAAKPAPQKSVYDSLEQEMASLLGRPNSKA
jgi:flagellar protein FliO/FliZ